MRIVFINCPRCGKLFCVETLLTLNRLPLHCPGCDAYLEHREYSPQLAGTATTALARLRHPLNEATIREVVYLPAQTGGQRCSNPEDGAS